MERLFLEILRSQMPCWSCRGITGPAMVVELPPTGEVALRAGGPGASRIMAWSSIKLLERREPNSSLSSKSDSESVWAGAKSGVAPVLLSERLRRKQGPTLLSRPEGAAEDCLLRLVMLRDARLERRRMRLPLLEGVGIGETGPLLAISVSGLPLPVQLWARELTLVFRETIDSGS